MPRVAFSTFVKWLTLPPSTLSAEIQKYATPKGYDFYRTLRDAARDYAGQKVDFDTAKEPILALKNESELTHNLKALNALKAWLQSRSTETHSPPPPKIYKGPQNLFQVRVQPEFTLEYKDDLWIVQIFPNSKTSLTPNMVEPALHLLKSRYQGGQFDNHRPAILDLNKNRIYGQNWNSNRAATNFSHVVDDIARRFNELDI